MVTKLNISTTGYKETNEAFKNIRKELTNFNVPLMNSGEYYLEEIDKNFKTQGKTFSEGWEPLSESTIKIKQKEYDKGRAIAVNEPLIRTGEMRESFYFDITKNNVTINNKLTYALSHQLGIGVPKRLLAAVDNTRTLKVVNIFETWLTNILNKNFNNTQI